jgi:chitodextrinase
MVRAHGTSFRNKYLRVGIVVLAVASIATLGIHTYHGAAAAFLKYDPSDPNYAEKVDFVVTSTVIKTAPDDPIVYPGQPGLSHDHTFSCNTSINASSTPWTLWAAKTTNCNLSRDHASYWTPTLYANGAKVIPFQSRAYYRAGTNKTANIHPIPFGLRMIAGDAKATAPQNGGIAGFQCRNLTAGDTIGKQALPPACAAGDFLEASIVFPNCWDGKNLDSADHKSHMAYATGKMPAVCDAAHPIEIPQLTYAQRYPPDAFRGKTLTIASMLTTNSVYTMHSDFMNAWDPVMMQWLVDNCLKASIACETISDDRMIPGMTPPPAATSVPPDPGGSPPPPPMDMTPPSAPSALAAGTKTASSIALSWGASTDNIAVTGYQVFRGTTKVGTTTASVRTYSDTGLTAGTAYVYTVKATDAAGNLSAASNALSVTTTAAADTIPPSVSITAPTNGTSVTIGAAVPISTAASDNVGVTKVEFYVNNVLKSPDLQAPYSFSWSTAGLPAGTYSLTAKAYDAAGLSKVSTAVSVTVIAVQTGSKGDANKDGRVNALDLSVLITHDSQNYPAADFNNDGTVGAADLAILLANWTW